MYFSAKSWFFLKYKFRYLARLQNEKKFVPVYQTTRYHNSDTRNFNLNIISVSIYNSVPLLHLLLLLSPFLLFYLFTAYPDVRLFCYITLSTSLSHFISAVPYNTQHTLAPANSTDIVGELERYWGLSYTKHYELRLWAPVLRIASDTY